MEFPAVGWRDYSDGSLGNAGQYGYYWTSVANSSYGAYYLYFGSSSLYVTAPDKRPGQSVRCVR
ncbi:MAG: hypothetical protein K2N21_04700 [Rikenellaceae bacterium]|nr:hypothetical protein [Rikenellaceae bacterium]